MDAGKGISMASKYIYLVREATFERELLAVFTKKCDAISRSMVQFRLPEEHALLSRMRDGLGDKTEEDIPWMRERTR